MDGNGRGFQLLNDSKKTSEVDEQKEEATGTKEKYQEYENMDNNFMGSIFIDFLFR